APRTDDGVFILGDSVVGYLDGSEESVLEIIRISSDISASSTELLSRASTWPEKYHTDPARANVLRSLDIPHDSRVLEIGAGCGPITRYLGETVALVDALEPATARARVARERTKDLHNVEVFVGELADLPREAAYDVIVVVGVLEYIATGAKDERPYLEFLEAIKSRLEPGGSLVLAVENKLGVKYLAGSPENHTGRAFDSIEDYPHGTNARTFGRAALQEMLGQAGFSANLLGVFPDYKMTRAVLDYERLPAHARQLLYQIPNFPSPARGLDQLALASEGLLWRELVEAGLAPEFPNSFLAIGQLNKDSVKLWPEDRAAGFFANHRRQSFQAQTIVQRHGDSVRFVRSFAPEPSPLISTEMSVASFVSGAPFIEIFADASDTARRELLQSWRSLVEASASEGGTPVDAIPLNVLVDADGQLELIDIEFRSPDYSREFVIERGVFWLGIQLAQTTSPALWPQHGRVREMVVGLGALAGLDTSGGWIEPAIAKEATFQSLVTTIYDGDNPEGLWEAELNRLLDQDMAAVPLGHRLNDLYNASVRSIRLLESDAAAASLLISDLESRIQGSATRLREALAELEVTRTEGTRLLQMSRNETYAVKSQLEGVLRSRAFRTLSYARRAINKIAPWGTHRRGLYERGLRLAGRVARLRRRRPAVVAPAVVPRLPFSKKPLVSIVVPIHGKWEFTSRCLESVARCHEGHQIEVIVVDDASPDNSREMLAGIVGVRVVALDENVGFTRAANAGIAAARGEYVVMLNNDAEVTAGWLAALLDAASDENIGLVGAKLVYPDGRLQEAGGIIFDDGNGWNYGKFDDPAAPQYNFRKEVDYCSGAAVLITRKLLDVTGGFDERYAPAYYEDADLAFEARENGLRVVYEPKAVVIHHEGISHGSDEAVGTKRFQPINREKFLAKWAHVLLGQRSNSHASVTLASVRRGSNGTVVVVDHMVPRWRDDSGSLRMHRLLLSLVHMGYEVIFVPENKDPFPPYTADLQASGILVWYGEVDLWSYLREIESAITMVMLSRASVASLYIRHFREVLPDTPVVFDTVDLHFLREQRRADLGDAGGKHKGALATRELELALVRSADSTLVVSDYEKEVLGELVPAAPIFVLPNAHDSVAVGSTARRTEISFIGSFQHDPNADAVRWLVKDIFPRIKSRLPLARLTIVGRNPPSDVVAAAPPGVEFLGWVEDLEPIHARSIVSVAPLRYGAGVKGKVGEAWAHGVPVVMTTTAAEGMQVEPGKTALVADDAESFAEAVVRLYSDQELWQSIANAARVHVDRTFGTERFRALLLEIIEHAKHV
ncbi:MAG: glycosyltransferase, partial [Lacisediminihabitans sp.]